METTASRKRMADEAASRFSEEDKKEELSPITILEIDVEVPNGKRYIGKFRFQVPTLGDLIDIGSTCARYLGQIENSNPTAEALAHALAFLHVTIKEDKINPTWWRETSRGVDLYHSKPIFTLYRLAVEYQAKYLGASVEVGDIKKSPEDGSNEDDSGDVGGDVQPAPERRTIMQIDGKGSPRTNNDDAGHTGDKE
jgi:hypothetical protein